MKRALLFILLCTILQLAVWAQQAAQQTPAQQTSAQQTAGTAMLEITGDIPHPHAYQEQEWKQLKHVSVTATNNQDKKTARYSGVPLYDLLKEAGVPTGDAMRGKGMKTYVMVTAADGYQVLFALSDLDEQIGHLQVIVADSEDGKPIVPNVGPLRLIVPTDTRPVRWARMVKSVRVVANP